MNNPWLSILIPSIYPEKLARFLSTLQQNVPEFVYFTGDGSNLGRVPLIKDGEFELIIDTEPADGIGELYSRMFAKAKGEWIWIANDDLSCETPSWLYHFKQATLIHDDGIALIYPNDKLFEDTFCCFPLVKKSVVEPLFPMNYKKYKIDDSIMHIIPKSRYIYLDNVVMRHMNYNVIGQPGFQTKTGNVYPIDPVLAEIDGKLWDANTPSRSLIANKILNIVNGVIETPGQKRVMVGCSTAEFARRADFYDYFNAMIKPEGTVCTFAHGQSPAENRNILIDQAFQIGATHILFLDDDIAFKQPLLTDLMEHNLDIVTGLMYKRNYPHAPLIFDIVDEEGRCRHKALDPDEKGLIEVVAAGLGCCLISMEVFKKLERPYIRLGELDKSGWNDDIGFFKRVREAGFKIYCDLDILVGHIASMIIWPDKIDGKWMSTYDTYGSGKASVPQFERAKELVQ